MVDPAGVNTNSPAQNPGQGAPTPQKRRPLWHWLTGAALLLLAGTGAFLVLRDRGDQPPGESSKEPLRGELTVTVRSAERRKESARVDEPGSLPVRGGGMMDLKVQLNQPAFVYLVWLDSQGRAIPLYPWNDDELEVTDANTPPPVARATKLVSSPTTITNGWRFGKRGGLETVLLLARRTPLGKDVQLGALLGPIPKTRMRAREELAVLAWDRGAAAASTLRASNRGTDEEAREADGPLLALMARLRDQFELIRVVRFAHEGE